MTDEDKKSAEDAEEGRSDTDGGDDAEAESSATEASGSDAESEPASSPKTRTKSKRKATPASESSEPEGGALAKTTDDDEGRMDLPKWNRAKVKRKQVKGEEKDAFQRGVRKAGRVTLARAPVVLAAIVAVAGIVSGVVWYRNRQAEQAAVATRILAQAVGFQARAQVVDDISQFTKDRKHPFPIPLVTSEEERDTKVDKALSELDASAEGGPADVLAGLVEAARLSRQGRHGDAEAQYRAFLEGNPSHELAFVARESLAFALEAQGNTDGAVAEFEALAGKEGDFYRDQALWHKGRILEAQGKAEEALAVYKQYIAEYPLEESSMARDQVVARLQELAPDLVPKPEADAGGFGGGLPLGLGQ